MKREHWLLIGAAAGGALIWVLIATASGKKEAWDSELYFSVGMPAVCLLAALLGFLEPKQTWRWGAAPLAGQFLAMLLMVGPGICCRSASSCSECWRSRRSFSRAWALTFETALRIERRKQSGN